MENVIKELTDFRLKIDELYKNVQLLESSDYLGECKKCLLLSRTHLGRLQGEFSMPNSYKVVTEVKDIPKVYDVYDGDLFTMNTSVTQLEGINWIRKELDNLIKEIDNFRDKSIMKGYKQNMFIQFTYKDLYDAKSWLGWELGRMRDAV